MKLRIVHEEEVQFKPLQDNTFKLELHEGHFDVVLGKYLRVILEV